MNCGNCGVELKKGDKFCSGCGREVVIEVNYDEVIETNNTNQDSKREYRSDNSGDSSNNDFFEDLKGIFLDIFKNPSNLVNRALQMKINSAVIIALGALFFTFIEKLIMGISINIFSLSVIIEIWKSVIWQGVSIVLMVGILFYMINSKRNKDEKFSVSKVFSVFMVPYAVKVITSLLAYALIKFRLPYIPGIISTFGIVIFILVMYKLLSGKKLMDDKTAIYIVAILAFLA